MSWGLRLRLGSLMFLQYFVWGAWYVTLGTYLGIGLHFSGTQVGWTAGATAVGAIVAPLFVGLIADRFLPAQRALGVLHLLGAALLWLAASQLTFPALYAAILGYCLCYMPTLALSNSLVFRQMQDPQGEFGPIRAFGTVGWIVAGVLIGLLAVEATALPLRIASVTSLILGLYCFTLPHTPALAGQNAGQNVGQNVGQDTGQHAAWQRGVWQRALPVLRERSTLVFALASMLICIPLQFYYAFTNLFLNEIGVPSAAAKMSGGQASELLCMLALPLFFRRLGVKYMMAFGMIAWVVRYLCFAWGNASGLAALLWGGILLHGICYDFFFVTGQIYIDRKAPLELRAATQGLITFLTYGVGMFLGSWLSGLVVDAYASTSNALVQHDWRMIWMIGAAFAAVVLGVFLLLFNADEKAQSTAPAGALGPQASGT